MFSVVVYLQVQTKALRSCPCSSPEFTRTCVTWVSVRVCTPRPSRWGERWETSRSSSTTPAWFRDVTSSSVPTNWSRGPWWSTATPTSGSVGGSFSLLACFKSDTWLSRMLTCFTCFTDHQSFSPEDAGVKRGTHRDRRQLAGALHHGRGRGVCSVFLLFNSGINILLSGDLILLLYPLLSPSPFLAGLLRQQIRSHRFPRVPEPRVKGG